VRSPLRILIVAAASALLIGQAQALQYRQSKTVDDNLARTLLQYAKDAPPQLHKIIGDVPIYVMDDIAMFKSPAVARELKMNRAFQQSVSNGLAGLAMWPIAKGRGFRSISLFADKIRDAPAERQRAIVVHELMHQLDHALGNASQNRTFMAAYKTDVQNFNKMTRTMSAEDREFFNRWLGYYIKSSHEAFAEVATHLVYPQSNGDERAIFFGVFSNTAAALEKMLRARDIPIDVRKATPATIDWPEAGSRSGSCLIGEGLVRPCTRQ